MEDTILTPGSTPADPAPDAAAADPKATQPVDGIANPAPNPEDGKTPDPTKPDGDKPPGEKDEPKDDGKDGDKTKVDGAPETYEAFTAPEGVELDATAVEAFQPVAKELNLSQEQAQKLVDLYAGQQAKAAEQLQAQWAATQEAWITSLKADSEIGGDKMDESVSVARQAIKRFGGENEQKLADALTVTGAGNHPEIIRFMARVGRAIADDGFVRADSSASGPRDRASILYPKS